MEFTRREFLKVSAISFCSLVVSTGLSGCSTIFNPTDVKFLHGVASGDPLSDKVIIWTRLTPKDELKTLNLAYEVSKSVDFKVLVHSGFVKARKKNNYTVKIDLHNLEEDTVYYYRFKSNYEVIEGKTKTLASNPSSVKLAVFSCSNYTNGYFNAYMEASKLSDVDVVLHLGDYIYEYGMFEDDGVTPAYATKNASKIGRELPKHNDKELLTLDDYRNRYALYRSDEGSIALHKNTPFICVWDDHEIANDIYKDGAENHNENDGDFDERKLAALKAYFEWLPIRPVKENDNETIYREFNFGELVNLYMLDTRVIARDKQLEYSSYFNADGSFEQTKFVADVSNTNRSLLGAEQLNWLQNKIISSSAKWQVLGQQVLMGRMNLPAELLKLIVLLNSASQEQKGAILTQMNSLIGQLVAIKMRLLANDPTLSDEEKARVTTALPYNLDAWDGYAYEREVLFSTFKNLDKNLIVLAGDTHNSWANNLKDASGNNIGVEFATTSVSSPGMEEYVGLSTTQASISFENAISLLVDDLQYTNLNQRGFMTVKFTKEEIETNWYYVNSNDSTTYSIDTTRNKTIKVKDKTALV